MQNLPDFDVSRFYLGKLCSRKHDYFGTGKSLRYMKRSCVECERQRSRRQSCEQKARRQERRFSTAPHCPYPKPDFDSSLFYLGQLCRRRHDFCNGLSLRSRKDRSCPECKCARAKEDRAANPEKYATQAKRYYSANKERIAEYYRHQYSLKRTEILARHKEYRRENAQKERLRSKRYRQSPQGRRSGRNSVYKRRALKLSAHRVHWSQQDLNRRFAEFGNRCAYCGSASKTTIDHFIPLSKGGSDCIGNILPACKSCNSSKHNNLASEWYEVQDFFSKTRWKKILAAIKGAEIGQIPLL